MIRRVKGIWIEGFLNRSLDRIARIELGLEDRPEAVAHPWDAVVQQPDRKPRQLPLGTSATDVFDEVHGTLLILGAPGAGKTTTLLELTRDLLVRADQDASMPIPVVFHLATWAVQRQPLSEWIVEELASERYKVPRDLAQEWVKQEKILPLLDGFDEVAFGYRSQCATAINQFQKEHGFLSLVVCSRTAEYRALGIQLHLEAAILIQPLNQRQISSYLLQLGDPLENMRRALERDRTLWEIVETPLLLSIAVLAYQGESSTALPSGGTAEDRRRRLLMAYVEKMFKHRRACDDVTKQRTIRWLAYIARGLAWRWQSAFYPSSISVNWLPSLFQQYLIIGSTCFFAGLFPGLATGIIMSLLFGPAVGVFSGIVSGLAGALIGLPTARDEDLSLLDVAGSTRLGRLWEGIRNTGRSIFWSSIILVLVGGILGLVIAATLALSRNGSINNEGFNGLLIGGALGAFVAFSTAPTIWRITDILPLLNRHGLHPNANTRVPLTIAVDLTLSVGIVSSILLTLVVDSTVALTIGCLMGLAVGYGTTGVLIARYWGVRLLLAWDGLAPRQYRDFLPDAAGRTFLYKVGEGYVFLHRLVLDYFAQLEFLEAKHFDPWMGLQRWNLTPEMAVQQALHLAEETNPDGALTAFNWVADQDHNLDLAPVAIQLSQVFLQQVIAREGTRLYSRDISHARSFEVARSLLQGAIEDGNGVVAAKAAFGLGELLRHQAPVIRPNSKHDEPRYAPGAQGLLDQAKMAYELAAKSGESPYDHLANQQLGLLALRRPGDKPSPLDW
jgi:hypothetical protein